MINNVERMFDKSNPPETVYFDGLYCDVGIIDYDNKLFSFTVINGSWNGVFTVTNDETGDGEILITAFNRTLKTKLLIVDVPFSGDYNYVVEECKQICLTI
jgi:hypothetical protein